MSFGRKIAEGDPREVMASAAVREVYLGRRCEMTATRCSSTSTASIDRRRLRRLPGAVRRVAGRRRGPDRGDHRRQRRRQEHPAAGRDGTGADRHAARSAIAATISVTLATHAARGTRACARARGAATVPEPVRVREPEDRRPRRAVGAVDDRTRGRAVPAAGAAARAARPMCCRAARSRRSRSGGR